jgi:hypothetical protein
MSDLMSVSEIFVLKFSWWIHGWTPVMVFQHHDGAFILFCWSLLEHYTFDSPSCVGITLKSLGTPLNHIVNLFASSTHQMHLIVSLFLIGPIRPLMTLINPPLLRDGMSPVTPLCPDMAVPCFKRHPSQS